MDQDSVSDESVVNPCNDVISNDVVSTCVVAHENKHPIMPSEAKISDLNLSSENIVSMSSASILGATTRRFISYSSPIKFKLVRIGASNSNSKQA